jgi:hypothetical protein
MNVPKRRCSPLRSPGEIRRELDSLAVRRSALWRGLGAGHDPGASSELSMLEARMSRLWRELRETRARIVFGPSEHIRARARMEIALERELELRRLRRPVPAFRARGAWEEPVASHEGA